MIPSSATPKWSNAWAMAAFANRRDAWTLSSGQGTKTVYVQFRDGAGNRSGVVTDTIRFAR
jgi:hypothetical protein